MLFNSLEFAIFFALCVAVVWALPHRGQNRFLLVSSYVFYAAWDWRFLGLIVLSTVVDYAVARAMPGSQAQRRRQLLLASIAVNLGALGFFKYAGFFAGGLTDLAALFGWTLSPFTLNVVLPVGISFYTFQTLGYTIDVYRGRVEPAKNLLDFALFVAFFPQLVAGPIERARHLLPQVEAPRRITWDALSSGAWLCFWGIFKKAVIADNLARAVDVAYAPGATPAAGELILATYAFAFQIYCDFSGYTDVARGTARILGFDIMRNFDLPYLATSMQDFWRRWHISLSTWLRDYLYIPLGGSRRGPARTYANLAITMLLGGLWHGAAWGFVLWGAYHGALLALHRALRPALARFAPQGRAASAAWWLLRVALVFHLVCLGWLFFRAESLAEVARLLAVLALPWQAGIAASWLMPFLLLAAPLLLVQLAQAWTRDPEPVARLPLAARSIVYTFLLVMLVVMGQDGGRPFVYFQF